MNISIAWDNDEHTIIRYVFSKGWNWEELHEIFQETNRMMDTVDHRVCDIMDFTNASIFVPPHAIYQGRHILKNERHHNLGMTVIAGSMFVNNIYGMLKRIMSKDPTEVWDVAFVKDLPEAYSAIEAYNRRKANDKDDTAPNDNT